MTYRSHPYASIYYCTHQYFSINFETKLLWKSIYFVFLQILILLTQESHFWRLMLWTKKVNSWDETYLHLLNNRIFVEKSFENLYYTNLSKLIQESIQILVNENNKSFDPSQSKCLIRVPKKLVSTLKSAYISVSNESIL
jgi:hypothetical protein